MSLTSVLFPEPHTPVTAVNVPSGKATSMSFRLCARAPRTVSVRFFGRPAAARPVAGLLVAAQVGPGQRAGGSSRSSTSPWRRCRPPWRPAPGPMSITWSAERIVSSSCSTTMHGVTQVAERRSVSEQARVVARVEPDAGLVEDVEDAHEPAADLRGEPDPLRLTAGQRLRLRPSVRYWSPTSTRKVSRSRDLLEDRAGRCGRGAPGGPPARRRRGKGSGGSRAPRSRSYPRSRRCSAPRR